MHKKALRTLFLALPLVIAGCGGGGGGGGSGGEDRYRNLDGPIPDPIDNPSITTSGSIAPKAGSGGLFDINIAGFLAPESPAARSVYARAVAAGLTTDDFTVVEYDLVAGVRGDGVVKGTTVERISADARATADVVFVFDTTGSMDMALSSVQDSIIAFSEELETSGLDIRLGAVTFGDAYDTLAAADGRIGGVSLTGKTPADSPHDSDERPTFNLSDNFELFRQFIEQDSARGGGDGAENALGALEFAYDRLSWREGAQRIIIVIMDIYSHNDTSYSFAAAAEFWKPSSHAAVLTRLKGNATVHVIAPEYRDAEDGFVSTRFTDMAYFTDAAGTGGVHVPWRSFEAFDLSDLPISAATRGGYIATYRPTCDGGEKEVRVVIDDGDTIKGEFSTRAPGC